MADNVYAISKIVGTSKKSIEDAIENAVSRASETRQHLDWFEVVETRGYLKYGKVAYYQVSLENSFRHEN